MPHDELALLNDWQRGFPLLPRPFDLIAQGAGMQGAHVLQAYARMQAAGSISRIGGIWAAGAGGAAMLCALAVPPQRLAEVAARVNAEPGVNHNYEREHRYNMWFVITGASVAHLHARVDAIEQACGLSALRLPMRRPYRIDLGFDLRGRHAGCHQALAAPGARKALPVAEADRPLAALLECGLPLCERPYARWAELLGGTQNEDDVLLKLHQWLEQGTLRRLGVIVRHHESGFDANAMTVFDVADELVDAVGEQLAVQDGITLCYRRERAAGWPYNLYCMVHGRDRDSVRDLVARAIVQTGLQQVPQAMLFSRQRFKQVGGRYFSDALPAGAGARIEPAQPSVATAPAASASVEPLHAAA